MKNPTHAELIYRKMNHEKEKSSFSRGHVAATNSKKDRHFLKTHNVIMSKKYKTMLKRMDLNYIAAERGF